MSFPNLRMPLAVALGCMLSVPVLHAADSDATAGTEDIVLPTVVVTAQLLNEKRAAIETQTGASTYTIDDAAIADILTREVDDPVVCRRRGREHIWHVNRPTRLTGCRIQRRERPIRHEREQGAPVVRDPR